GVGVVAVLPPLAGRAWWPAARAPPALAAGRPGARPALAHGLWLLVLLKLLTPPLVPVPLPPLRSPPAAHETVPDYPPSETVHHGIEPPAPAPPPEAAAEPATPAEALPPAPGPAGEAAGWKPALLALWLTGAAGWWALAAVRLARLRGVLRGLPPAPDAVQAQARGLAARLGLRRCPTVWLVPGPVSPMLLALGP